MTNKKPQFLNTIRVALCCLLPIIMLLVSCKETKEEKRSPNIIYILADDMGYGDVSILNKESKIFTPNLDRLGQEGILFTDAHTSSSVCTPTRYGILTGRYNWRSRLKSGVLTGKSKALIPNTRTTVASMLKKKGYTTAFIGKWHLGWDWAYENNTDTGGEGWNKEDFKNIDFTKPVVNNPNDLGFDYAYGHSGSLDMAPYVYVENGRVTSIPRSTTIDKGKYSWWREGPTAKDFVHEEVTPNFFNRANEYIEKAAANNTPFFLYLALPSPHTPILPTKAWKGKSGLLPYADFVLMVDHYLGELLNRLKKEGIEENTLVIFTSDNGCSPAAGIEELQEQGHYPSYIYRGHKADIFEGGHRVPFMVKWPSVIKPGSKSDALVGTTDLMATLAEITSYSLKEDEGEDSISMLPLFQEETKNTHRRETLVNHSINGNFAIRKGDWKLIMTPGSGGWSYPNPSKDSLALKSLPPMQLYNLKTDPQESKNLYDKETSRVTELKNILINQIEKGRSTGGAPQENDSINFEWTQINFINS